MFDNITESSPDGIHDPITLPGMDQLDVAISVGRPGEVREGEYYIAQSSEVDARLGRMWWRNRRWHRHENR